jgi:nitroreductase
VEYTELLKKRRSIRKYLASPVSDNDIKNVLEAARLAPSWGNRQCWQFIVVKEQGTKEKIAGENRKWISEAPVIIAACADPSASGRKPGMDYFMLDVGIAFEHLVLAAANLGLGTCWIGAFDEEQVKVALGVPGDIRAVAFTPLGYPAEKKGDVSNRKLLQEIVFYEKYAAKQAQGAADRLINTINRQYRKGRGLIAKLRNRLAF